MNFFTVSDLPATEMLPGITRHEQITYVLEGTMDFTLGSETRILRAGDGVCIPPNTPHSARILEAPTRALDAWHPVREDYK
ncbi:MAG: cupin domain-containing protein [Anaerolineae bacterium]|jgi:quercetin dioxygenase-like cupin family protein|nr:cupin domain-containing protein [Anaerolineae bacterium]MDH7473694.1 cupin domain-containing protein [Anaerolineae bacterium]